MRKNAVSPVGVLPPIPSELITGRPKKEAASIEYSSDLLPYSEKVFIGIDPSLSSTAIAVLHRGKVTLTTIYPKCLGMERFMYIRDAVREILYACGEEVGGVFIEGFSYGSVGRIADLAQLGGILRMDLTEMGLTLIECPPTTLKKYATDNGHATKDLIIQKAKDRYGLVTRDNNKADAFFLALAAQSYLTVETALRTKDQLLLSKGCRVLAGKDPYNRTEILQKQKRQAKAKKASKSK